MPSRWPRPSCRAGHRRDLGSCAPPGAGVAGPGLSIRDGKPTTMSDELIQRVLKVIATSKRIPLETVTIDSDFLQLGIDSMDAVEILFALENEFDISIPDDEVRSLGNIRQMR